MTRAARMGAWRFTMWLPLALLAVASAQQAAPAMDANLLEKRLQFIETTPAEIASARAELLTGMHEMVAQKKLKPDEVRKVCEVVSKQTAGTVDGLRSLVALLSKAEVQAAMSAEQRARLEAARPAVEQLAPAMDCSGI